jgi:histidyl-tRNA synthetase
MDLAGRSLKGQLRHARRLGARVISVIGPDEWGRGVARLRDDAVPLEDDVPLERLVVTVEEALMLLTDTGGR